MSVLIKGMDMPKNCWECFVEHSLNVDVVGFGGHCPFGERIVSSEEFDAKAGIHPDCPFVEVPTPHGRLIDADKLERDIEEYHLSNGKFQHWVQVQNSIIEAEEGEEA